ncbi:hypothetical protein ABT354_23505 [Streptomyces sp. NPDC000594]|uniref:hypothetical protein n=1 Tax=Streptomyces sp. NPDC000594 TaxID=3154261 RepID=UPI0033169DF0
MTIARRAPLAAMALALTVATLTGFTPPPDRPDRSGSMEVCSPPHPGGRFLCDHGVLSAGAALALAVPLAPVSGAVTGGGLFSGTAPSADGASGGGSVMTRQAPILDAAYEITDLVQKYPDRGYNGLRISVETYGYTVRWKGKPPGNIARVIASHRRKGLDVTVAAARYSAVELKKRSHAIITSGVRVNGARIVSAGPGKDGNSLAVGIESPSANRPVTRKRKASGGIPSALTRGIPVTLRTESAASPLGDERTGFRGSMVFGGQGLRTADSAWCTIGFTGRAGSKDYVITAEHCATGTPGRFRTATGDSFGTLRSRDVVNDAAFIEMDPGRSNGSAVVGGDPVRSPGQPVHPVIATADVFEGQFVCLSGSLTGEVCSLPVTDGFRWVRTTDGKVRWSAAAGRWDYPVDHTAGPGDSGGPVYSYRPGGVVAHGLISSGTGVKPCPNPLTGRPRSDLCSKVTHFTSIERAMARYPGMSLTRR